MTDENTDAAEQADVAAHYRRRLDTAGAVRLSAGELVEAFGYRELSDDAREVVAEHLWDAGLLTQPSLERGATDARSQLKLVDRARAEQGDVRYAINPAGVALACIGAIAMAIAAFLPLDESGAFARVQENALIHHGGWAFVALGAGIAVSAYRQYSAGKLGWTPIVLGAIALADAILTAKNHGYRTLYPLNSAGEPDASAPGTLVPLGLAVYVAGAGACLAMLGGLVMRQSSGNARTSPQTTKACPDCAETILAAANVCKHCGHRFDAEPQPTPAP